MDAASPLGRLGTLEGYRKSFTDAVLWRPYVERICREHGWSCNLVSTGVAGTFPTFIVDKQRVVKFFGRLFEGERAGAWSRKRRSYCQIILPSRWCS